MQLRALNARAGQKDNSDLLRKAELRRCFCRDVKRANIFLAGAGFGEMFRHAWCQKARYTLALDTNARKVADFRFHFPGADVRVADFQTFQEWPQRHRFQIADFDAFGDLYPGMLHFLDDAPWEDPLDIIVGDSKVLAFKRSGHVSPQLAHARKRTSFMGARHLDSYMERFVWPWWKRVAMKRGFEIARKCYRSNKEKTVAYYALRLVASS
ncbi:MAG TPA: hypothetical protein PK468_21445 [Candidatus Hydrogenedentes bacterium]|nr:hypothetical protein [Candidatus Hydrogenedentota bacterium]